MKSLFVMCSDRFFDPHEKTLLSCIQTFNRLGPTQKEFFLPPPAMGGEAKLVYVVPQLEARSCKMQGHDMGGSSHSGDELDRTRVTSYSPKTYRKISIPIYKTSRTCCKGKGGTSISNRKDGERFPSSPARTVERAYKVSTGRDDRRVGIERE